MTTKPMNTTDQAPPRRPDESMTLLTSMMERPLDPGYAAAAELREQAGLPPATSLRSARVFVAALLVGALLTMGAMALRRPDTAATRARADLVQQIERRQKAADGRADQVRSLQADLALAQAAALELEQAGQGKRLTRLETSAGASPVQGPGLVVTLDDAESASGDSADGDPRTGSDDDGRVQSRDIQLVVNGLWAAGAEAVAVNGQRLTTLSAIRFAGEAILVNYRPLVRPYRIEAIGGSELEPGFAATAGGAYLQALRENFNIQTGIERDTELTLPSAVSLTLHNAASSPRTPRPSSSTPATSTPAISTPAISTPATSTETPR